MARTCDAMVVVGGSHSANSRHLYEICCSACANVQFIENAAQLDTSAFVHADTVGLTAGASVPAWIIKEVKQKMSDEILTQENPTETENFDEMLEASLKPIYNGEKVTGTVVAISGTEISVDIGTKYSGFIPTSEFTDDGIKVEDAVKVGDTVNAGTKIGMSGNTGTRTTGEHLHFELKQIGADGTKRNIDPAAYLAEIAVKGNIAVTAMHNGNNLLAKYADRIPQQDASGEDMAMEEIPAEDMTPDGWMKKLLSSEDSGVNLPSNDPVMEMAVTMFTSLMALAVQIDGKDREEAMALATDAAVNRHIDLSSLTPGLKACSLTIREGQNPILSITDDRGSFNHVLTNAEMTRLSAALNDPNLSNEAKQGRIAGIINNISVANQMSQSFDRQVGNDQNQGLQR